MTAVGSTSPQSSAAGSPPGAAPVGAAPGGVAAATAAPAAAPAEDVAPLPWQLAALTRPALLRAGSPLSTTARLALDWLIQAVAAALEQTLDRPVDIDIRLDPPSARESAAAAPAPFGVAFAHPATGGEGLIALDASLARTILDVLETDFANMRGTATFTDAEAGLLEYVALACVDAVLRGERGPRGPRGFELRRFLNAREVHDRVAEDNLPPGLLHVRIAGRGGLARLYLPHWEPGDFTAPGWAPATAPDLSLIVNVRVALPPVRLPSADAARLAPGDVILPGITGLANTPGCRLVTSNGWSLCTATVLRDSGDLITVQCGQFDLRVSEGANLGTQGFLVTPLLGKQMLALEQIQVWRSGMVLDLPKDLQTPVELHLGTDLLGWGELVGVEGEIGIRVVDVAAGAQRTLSAKP